MAVYKTIYSCFENLQNCSKLLLSTFPAPTARFSVNTMGFERLSPEGIPHREQTACDFLKYTACDPDVSLWDLHPGGQVLP